MAQKGQRCPFCSVFLFFGVFFSSFSPFQMGLGGLIAKGASKEEIKAEVEKLGEGWHQKVFVTEHPKHKCSFEFTPIGGAVVYGHIHILEAFLEILNGQFPYAYELVQLAGQERKEKSRCYSMVYRPKTRPERL
jgi:hypothetical protein